MDPRSHGIGKNTLKFCECVGGRGGGDGEGGTGRGGGEGEGDGGRGNTVFFLYEVVLLHGRGMVSQDPQGIQLKSFVKGRRMYLFHRDFSSCLESAEIWHADSFCVKKCPWVSFFHKRGNEASNTLLKVHPPPPPPLLPSSPSPQDAVEPHLTATPLCLSVITTTILVQSGQDPVIKHLNLLLTQPPDFYVPRFRPFGFRRCES